MPTLSVLDASGNPVTINTQNNNGQATMANSQPVAIASDQSAVPTSVADGSLATLGAKADASADADTGTFSLMAYVKWLCSKIKAAGQAAMAGSHPVVIASDQTAVAVKTSQIVKSQEITRPSDTTAYAANDVVGPTGGAAVGVLSDFFAANGASGYIAKVELITDKAADTSPYRIYFFNTAPTAIADNSPFVLTYADFAKMIGYVDISNMSQESSSSTGAWGLWTGQMPAKAADGDNDLYYVIVIKAALTPSSAQKYSVKVSNDSNG